jgi:hypothetical protein
LVLPAKAIAALCKLLARNTSSIGRTPRLKMKPHSGAESQRICDVYRSAAERFEEGAHTVRIDEKTGIQALARIHPDKPIRPGKPALLEFEYNRHGRQTLMPTFDVATGQIVVAHVGPTRNEAHFAAVVADTVSTDPDAEWVFVADQLNTHKSEPLVQTMARAFKWTYRGKALNA